MRTISRRSSPALAPALVAAAAILLSPATAAAATKNVTMNESYSYSPGTARVALGDTVKWVNNAVISKHDVQSKTLHGYFSSGIPGSIHPGHTYQFKFTSAGSFYYQCLFHAGDMYGYVVVPMKVTRTSSTKFTVTIGSVALPSTSPWIRVVEMDLPGGGSHYTTLKTTRKAFFTYKPATHGTFRFRSYLKSTGSAGQSATSPVVSISY